MNPRSGLIFVFSRPTLSVRGARPTATSTLSTSFTICLPSEPVTVTFTPAFVFSSFSNFALTKDSMPRLRKTRASSLLTSSSSFGTSRGSASTMVISVPKLLKIDPNSTPTAPDPMTTMDLGISFSDRISMLVSTWESACRPGSILASEPVARMTFFALMEVRSPSADPAAAACTSTE